MTVTPDVLDAIRDELLALPPEQQEAFIGGLQGAKRDIVAEAIRRPVLLPHQIPPGEGWRFWLMLAGRGAGKTFAAADWFNRHMMGPPCDKRIAGGHQALIVGPTLGDVWNSCIKGPSGLEATNPAVVATGGAGGLHVRWPNGAVARTAGAYGPRDVESLRPKGNNCAVWAEELAAWAYLDKAWEQIDLGLRIGDHPRLVASTTPKPRVTIKALLKDRRCAITKASTRDNPHLDPGVRETLYEKYAGTRLGRQELDAELLEDVEGALWKMELIDATRWDGDWRENDRGILVPALPPLKRVGVGLDPPGGGTEAGIVAAGVGDDKRGYVLADYSLTAGPDEWGKRTVSCFNDHDADAVVAEVNYGGDMVPHVLAGIDPTVPIKQVRATRGKVRRAEPIVGLYEQHRVVHVGRFPELEAEMTTWVDEPGAASPNRIDALVWILWWLMVGRPHKPGRGAVEQITSARIDPHR